MRLLSWFGLGFFLITVLILALDLWQWQILDQSREFMRISGIFDTLIGDGSAQALEDKLPDYAKQVMDWYAALVFGIPAILIFLKNYSQKRKRVDLR